MQFERHVSGTREDLKVYHRRFVAIGEAGPDRQGTDPAHYFVEEHKHLAVHNLFKFVEQGAQIRGRRTEIDGPPEVGPFVLNLGGRQDSPVGVNQLHQVRDHG